jgi:hypothetical protein
MSLLCNACNEDKDIVSRCYECRFRICLDCLFKLYHNQSIPVQIFPSNIHICPICWQYFEVDLLKYIYNNPEDKALYINIHMQSVYFDRLLKSFLKNQLSKEDLKTKAEKHMLRNNSYKWRY